MPTHEPLALALRDVGAVSCPFAGFIIETETTLASFHALSTSDRESRARMLRDPHCPFVMLRDRRTGHVVAAIQAGAALHRFGAGSLRAPQARRSLRAGLR